MLLSLESTIRNCDFFPDPLLKVLVPNYVAGALLGKGGAMLTQLKDEYKANIRLSGGSDYYPGTEVR